jgi:hypothetical protein
VARRWSAVVGSDVSARDGLGWELMSRANEREGVWAVLRKDGGPFPVFSSARAEGALPPRDELEEMTMTAVADLLAAAGLADDNGWVTRNITAALLFASCDIVSWEGEEWALESGADEEASAWAGPGDPRTPYAWLRARGVASDAVIGVYQDDANFGLCFIPTTEPCLPESDTGSLRSRRDIPLTCGRINQVEVVYDTVVEGGRCSGLVSEALLHGERASTHLIAAEAYSRDEWHLYDESVVALTDPAAADALDWIPARRRWRPTEGAPP